MKIYDDMTTYEPTTPVEGYLKRIGDRSGDDSGSVLVPATTDTLGGVIIGEGINVDSEGRISVNPQTVITQADLVDEDTTEADLLDILLNGMSKPEP